MIFSNRCFSETGYQSWISNYKTVYYFTLLQAQWPALSRPVSNVVSHTRTHTHHSLAAVTAPADVLRSRLMAAVSLVFVILVTWS